MLAPSTFVPAPFTNIYNVHQRFWRVTPRVDYAINDKNTLTMRYSATHSDIPGAGIGNLDLPSRGYDYRYLNQTVQVSETLCWVDRSRNSIPILPQRPAQNRGQLAARDSGVGFF
jgi:hypothetical protein